MGYSGTQTFYKMRLPVSVEGWFVNGYIDSRERWLN